MPQSTKHAYARAAELVADVQHGGLTTREPANDAEPSNHQRTKTFTAAGKQWSAKKFTMKSILTVHDAAGGGL